MSSPLIHRHHISLPAGFAQSRGSPRATPGFVFGYVMRVKAPRVVIVGAGFGGITAAKA
jgi:hypothetical protein